MSVGGAWLRARSSGGEWPRRTPGTNQGNAGVRAKVRPRPPLKPSCAHGSCQPVVGREGDGLTEPGIFGHLRSGRFRLSGSNLAGFKLGGVGWAVSAGRCRLGRLGRRRGDGLTQSRRVRRPDSLRPPGGSRGFAWPEGFSADWLTAAGFTGGSGPTRRGPAGRV